MVFPPAFGGRTLVCMPGPAALPADTLCRRCDVDGLPFASTRELKALRGPFGQERAATATRFALSMRRSGYNLYVAGPGGHGKHAFVEHELRALAQTRRKAHDWCYVRDFARSDGARALCLPSGKAQSFAHDMDKLIDDLRVGIPAALESDSHRARLEEIREELEARSQAVFRRVEEDAQAFEVAMLRVPSGVGFAPMQDGQVLDPQEFEKLPRERRELFESSIKRLQDKLSRELRQMPKWAKEARDRAKELTREVVSQTVDQAFEELNAAWADHEDVAAHLAALRDDMLENAGRFHAQEDGEAPAQLNVHRVFDRYRVNVLVDTSDARGAPVVFETKPSLPRLVGPGRTPCRVGYPRE